MHPRQPRFKISKQAMLLGIISAAYPMVSYGVVAGRVDFAMGPVEAVALDGSRRPLSKGAEISAGDSINTANGGRAQLHFIDGGFISLQPNTLFRVDEYNFQNKTDGSERSFFSLLKGGLRAISGAIGHLNRNNYKVVTPSVTIGIRGTGYKAEVRDDGLLISVGEGAILLTNNAGSLLVSAGGGAYVANINTPPAPTSKQPQIPPANFQPLIDSTSIIKVKLPSLASGGGYVMAHAYQSGSTVSGSSIISGVTATFNDSSQLIKYTDSSGNGGDLGSATVSYSATDGTIGWGRWTGYTGNLPLVTTPGVFHYVIGIPTANMPTTGSATYSLMGFTTPSATDGSTGWSFKGDLSANFANNLVTLNMTVWNGSQDYTVSNGSISISGSSFSTSTAPLNTTSSTSLCASGCSTSVNGFFAGANASRAGLSYEVNNNFSNKVQGVAAFASTSTSTTLP